MQALKDRLTPSMQLVIVHVALVASEGVIVVISLLTEPSQSGGFLGFSFGRWAILLLNMFLLAGVCFVLYKVWNNQIGILETWLSSKSNLFGIFFISLILFGVSFPAALGKIPFIRYFVYFGRIRPSLIWLALASGQIWLTLSFVLRKPILLWFRQFFPFDTQAQEIKHLSKKYNIALLGITLLYLASQWWSHLQVEKALWLPDSIDYIFPATTYDWNEIGLWTHTKPWGAAILYKLTGRSPVTIDVVQTILSALAWLTLAWVFSKVIHRPWLRVTAFAIILGFSLAPSVQMWNHIIQSESLSISLMVLILVVWLSLLQRWRWDKLIALIFLFAWWMGTRETNVYLGLLVAGLLLFVGMIYKHQRFYWAVGVLLVFFGYVNMQISEVPTIPRWLYPLTNTVLHRILPNDEFLRYFEAKGLPVSAKLLSLSGGFADSENFAVFNNSALDEVERWLYKRGKEVYIRFLIDHPVYTLTSPWQQIHELLAPQVLMSYAPERYVPLFTCLFGGLFFLDSLWLLLLISALTLVVTLVAKSWRGSPAFWLVLGFLVLFFPHFYLVWHGDAAEVGRHAVQASVQLRLSLWLLFLLALDNIVGRNYAGE
jgi:hypothetical protein